jgi:hypothetical protein
MPETSTNRFTVHRSACAELERVLRSPGGPYTARQLALRLGCSKPTVYARLDALGRSGAKISVTEWRDPKKPGPVSCAYRIS